MLPNDHIRYSLFILALKEKPAYRGKSCSKVPCTIWIQYGTKDNIGGKLVKLSPLLGIKAVNTASIAIRKCSMIRS